MENVISFTDFVNELKIPCGPKTIVGKARENRMPQKSFQPTKILKNNQLKDLMFDFSNRKIRSENSLKDMIVDVSKTGHVPPAEIVKITVNDTKHLLVVDGQHRIMCCHFLGYDASYVELPEEELNIPIMSLIQHLNTHQKNWQIKDHVENLKKRDINFWKLFDELCNSAPTGLSKNCTLSFMLNIFVRKLEPFFSMSEDEIIQKYNIDEVKIRRRFNTITFILKEMSIIYNTHSQYFFEGLTKFLIEENPLIIYNTTFIEFLEEIDTAFKYPPSQVSHWYDHFKKMYHKYLRSV